MRTSAWLSSLIVVLLVPVLAGCGPELTPEEAVAAARSRYGAELQGFQVIEEPVQSAEAEAGDAEAEADDPEAEPAEMPEIKTEVLLDILLSTEGNELLAGLTLDLTQIDSDQAEKSRRTLWVDVTGVQPGVGKQITHVLTDIGYEPGDGFYVEVRSPIPPEERSEYREFDAP